MLTMKTLLTSPTSLVDTKLPSIANTAHQSLHYAPFIRATICTSIRTSNHVVFASSQEPSNKQETFGDVLSNIVNALSALQQPNAGLAKPTGAHVFASALTYHPPGAPKPLLRDVALNLPPNSLGLIFGRSGAGKSTLLQLISGLLEPTIGDIRFNGEHGPPLTAQQRMSRAGIVFQFPERHFIGTTVGEEISAGWPGVDTPQGMAARQQLTLRTYQVLNAVGLQDLPLESKLSALSDGYKRRVALAVQLVRQPELLLLDEPLAGLDWKTRAELVRVLKSLKKECTMLVVSHDLKEIGVLADTSWRMKTGGVLISEAPVSSFEGIGNRSVR